MRSTFVALSAIALVACSKPPPKNDAATTQNPAAATPEANADAVGATGAATGLSAGGAPAVKDTHRQDQTMAQGANSFTQGEARRHIEHDGYAGVADLMKDDAGVWHGRATKNGQAFDVALDFKGDVTAVAR